MLSCSCASETDCRLQSGEATVAFCKVSACVHCLSGRDKSLAASHHLSQLPPSTCRWERCFLVWVVRVQADRGANRDSSQSRPSQRPWHQGLRRPSGVAWEQTRQHPNQGSAGAWQRSAPFIESTSAFGNNMHVTVLACSAPFIVISVIRHDASCKRESSPRRPFHWRLGPLESRDGLAIAHHQLANNDRKQTWLTDSSGTNGARAFRPPSVVKLVFFIIRTASSQSGRPSGPWALTPLRVRSDFEIS